MRLGTVEVAGVPRLIALTADNWLLDLTAEAHARGEGAAAFKDMLTLIETGDVGLDQARGLLEDAPQSDLLDPNAVRYLPPILPVQYRDCLVFEEHLANCLAAFETMGGPKGAIPPVWYDQPIYYKGNRMSFIGHGQDVIWPAYAEFLDVELELAIVLGKQGKDIPENDAARHIFGYTILNDVSARDAQSKEMPGQLGPAKGKDFDTGNILGPYILTADEVDHPIALDMDLRVNGERWGGGNSRAMQHDFGAILAHISASETLYPGEVIGSGTVGTGCGLEQGRKLAPGDTFELEIEKIGTLINRIVRP
ncbi:fumarylacetoacetate hydrolase family protein [Chachezhania antarctica]|uniref:fumarylacetoacetate hydrolase family protein n=1 Tax=Chachezhania antarctica TaxID=2340860 RepID=UPI000EACA3D8|nr:fumarylacetoacetate hydrolase family protein [Chachezhania antarctica]|tara:strand:+ start:7724 stop:8650 length:927 start_codon:yes stop_codon:yes gene_type:complete